MRLFATMTAAIALAVSNEISATPIDEQLLQRAAAPRSFPATSGGTWTTGFAAARALVSQMTLEEKVNMTTGAAGSVCSGNTGAVPRLGLRSICLNDGPAGVHSVRNVSQFAAGITAAATWDVQLIGDRAEAMAAEARDKGINIVYGPVSGGPLGRSPRDGRNFEGFGSDEYLNGLATYHSVQRAQAAGIVVNLKHWLAYEQETSRGIKLIVPSLQQPIDSEVDEATLMQIYAWTFAEGIRAGAGSVMCSYNRVNGNHACESDPLLNDLLKTQLGFQGAVISDYGAVWSADFNNTVNNGLDLLMPGDSLQVIGFLDPIPNWFGSKGAKLANAVKSGAVAEARVDDMLLRLLTPVLQYQDLKSVRMPSFDINKFPAADPNDVRGNHADGIRQMGTESLTLLKNDRGSNGERGLPLNARALRKIAVSGQDAVASSDGGASCNALGMCNPFKPQGTVTAGGGSSFVSPPSVSDPLSAIKTYLASRNAATTVASSPDGLVLFLDAVRQARDADAAVVFASVYTQESSDRGSNLALDANGASLIRAVAGVNQNTIVVIHSPAAIDMEPFMTHPNVSAVLYAYYPGQESGAGLVPVLFGDQAPSGKLPFVIAKDVADYSPNGIVNQQFNPNPQSPFAERTLVDWKWLDTKGVQPCFHFGYGLSYTTFRYGALTVTPTAASDTTSLQPTKEKFEGAKAGASVYDIVYRATVTVQNTGTVAAKEVAQLYLSYPPTVSPAQAAHVLRGFSKQLIAAGQTVTYTFDMRRKDLSIWDPVARQWVIPKGTFRFFAAGQSGEWDSASTAEVVVQ